MATLVGSFCLTTDKQQNTYGLTVCNVTGSQVIPLPSLQTMSSYVHETETYFHHHLQTQ